MEKLELIKDYAKNSNLNYLRLNASKVSKNVDLGSMPYQYLLLFILENEVTLKDKKAQEGKLKYAGLPVIKKIENFDSNFQKSITQKQKQKQINRLVQMKRIERMYNLIFLSPSGVGETHISISLCYKSA